jgi:hypothetical protein
VPGTFNNKNHRIACYPVSMIDNYKPLLIIFSTSSMACLNAAINMIATLQVLDVTDTRGRD